MNPATTSDVQDSAVRYDRDADGIVTLTLDDPTASANTMTELYQRSMNTAVERLYADHEADPASVRGVIVASAKKTFFAGANLRELVAAGPDDAPQVFGSIEAAKATLRRLEKFPRPVVAAINGAALGGGFEITLACHRRIAVDHPTVQLGLPESTLGLLPGGGGVTRVTRMLGLQIALMEVLLPGTRFRPGDALAKGLIDETVPSVEQLIPAAREWILTQVERLTGDQSWPGNPWDRVGYQMPGGTTNSPALAAALPAFPAMLRKQAKGATYDAQQAVLCAAVEGAAVDFDTASRIESRYLTKLIVGPQSKNMIQAFFFDLQALTSGSLRPDGFEPWRATKVGVLGAGMMGAAIAYVCAKAGMQVVLKDVATEGAERGKAYSTGLLDKAIARGRSTEQAKAELLARILPTAEAADLAGCDLVIEAVFEDPSLKEKVFAEIAPYVSPEALLCSNTSTLPITELATGVDRPADFIGLHFFSPVDKMPLVEIIRGADTSDAALAKAYDVVQQIKKTPIVVNDSRGFYTSRVIGFMINEGLAMLAAGVAPMSVERAAMQAGYPVGPLQLADELNLELMTKIAAANRAAAESEGRELPRAAADDVIAAMIGAERPSRLAGAGFYDYVDGKRVGLWSDLGSLFPIADEQPPLADIADRMLFAEALETAKCFEEGVITSAAAANIGSIMGIGFPANTGGAAQFMTGYVGRDGALGLVAFLARADELADRYGERFRPTNYLRRLDRFPA